MKLKYIREHGALNSTFNILESFHVHGRANTELIFTQKEAQKEEDLKLEDAGELAEDFDDAEMQTDYTEQQTGLPALILTPTRELAMQVRFEC